MWQKSVRSISIAVHGVDQNVQGLILKNECSYKSDDIFLIMGTLEVFIASQYQIKWEKYTAHN